MWSPTSRWGIRFNAPPCLSMLRHALIPVAIVSHSGRSNILHSFHRLVCGPSIHSRIYFSVLSREAFLDRGHVWGLQARAIISFVCRSQLHRLEHQVFERGKSTGWRGCAGAIACQGQKPDSLQKTKGFNRRDGRTRELLQGPKGPNLSKGCMPKWKP